MRIHSTGLLGLAVMAIGLNGCLTDSTPPMLSINATNCAAAPDLAGAHPVTLKDDTPAKMVFDETTPCLQPAGAVARLYAVFRLPEATAPFWISVTSVPRGQGVVAPYVVMLDQDGKPTRQIPHDRFMFRGGSLQLGIRPQANETYLLVASNPDSVGQNTAGIVGSTQQTMVGGPGGYFMMATGQETMRSVTRAHGGTITVSAELLPKAPDTSSNHPSMAPLH